MARPNDTTAPGPGKRLACRRLLSVSVRVNEGRQTRESFRERRKSEFGRSSVGRCLADSAKVEEGGEGCTAWRMGEVEKEEGKKNAWRSSDQSGRLRAPERVGNGALAVLGGWGEEPGRFSLVASGHDDGPTRGWTGTSGHRPEEDDRGRIEGWMVRLGIKNGSLDNRQDTTGKKTELHSRI